MQKTFDKLQLLINERVAMAKTEAVLLVIWDLDEILWKEALIEGETTHLSVCCRLVRELSHRGIMNSICSRNDFNSVKIILERLGVWNYFIFPSIDWSEKSNRVTSIISNAQLRASTVLFIANDSGTRYEVQAAVPGIQVEDRSFVSKLLIDRRFKGKKDNKLTRLAHYKTLEKKKLGLVPLKDGVDIFSNKSSVGIDEIRLIGGGEIEPLVNYFGLNAQKVFSETNRIKGHLLVRKNSSALIRFSSFNDAAAVEEIKKLGFSEKDLSSDLFTVPDNNQTYLILTLWSDLAEAFYKNKKLGFRIPSCLVNANAQDLTTITDDDLSHSISNGKLDEEVSGRIRHFVDVIKSDYVFCGRQTIDVVEESVLKLLKEIPEKLPTYIIMPSLYMRDNGTEKPIEWSSRWRRLGDFILNTFTDVNLIWMDEAIAHVNDRLEGIDRFDERAYHNLFQIITDKIYANNLKKVEKNEIS